ncbi:ATP-binding protein [Streptomyces sp. WAC 00631]|uniref:ATP-binding protein n=1 Tax=Streptomyces sp. WAC 00631 TaxID=2203201 RepID=UPI00163CD0F7|nr:ATP-binding protein [Streptomyces sp. WAC 00631]MCC5031779.1 ATP-binding protein [Streptomyces sp. WAC 00631]
MTAPLHPNASVTVRMFTRRFASTPLGVQLARRHTVHQLDGWGVRRGSELSDAAALLVAELAANAVTHGRVPGRQFEVRARLCPVTLRIEVSDARGERRPPRPGTVTAPGPLAESGRGLLLVETLADRWRVLHRLGAGKTVRVELDLPG